MSPTALAVQPPVRGAGGPRGLNPLRTCVVAGCPMTSGLTPFDLDEALAAGFVRAGLGPWVLRAATAALVAVAS